MPTRYVVAQGDCISSIAYRFGFAIETVWKHPDNEPLRRARGVGHVLHPGDIVVIPDRRLREERCATGARHTFRRKDVPEKLRLRLIDVNDEPRSGLPYVLFVDDVVRGNGTADGDGVIEVDIPPNARKGKLVLGAEGEEELELALGHLDPVTEISGLRARLQNLGYYCAGPDDDPDELLVRAIEEFQIHHDLEPTGVADDALRERLVAEHGS